MMSRVMAPEEREAERVETARAMDDSAAAQSARAAQAPALSESTVVSFWRTRTTALRTDWNTSILNTRNAWLPASFPPVISTSEAVASSPEEEMTVTLREAAVTACP